jgi:hypothetical protein
MTYDPFFRCYKVTVKMREGAEFKFVVTGKYEVSFDYAIKYVLSTGDSARRTPTGSRTTF